MSSITDTECPICYEEIENNKNCVTTECGHNFHCSCLISYLHFCAKPAEESSPALRSHLRNEY